jgi:hypothetical protein
MRRIRDSRVKAHVVRSLALHVFLPVATGALIYVSWRSPTLLIFRWVRFCGMSGMLAKWRYAVLSGRPAFGDWVIFSLPDALWVYAVTACMSLIWRARRSWARRVWIAAGTVLGCGGEVLQQLGVVPGTYDPVDLLLSVAAALTSYLLVTNDLKFRREDNGCGHTLQADLP